MTVDTVFSNSAISAYMAVHMLNRARIAALVRAASKTLADTVLSEMDYIGTENSVDDIIETARKKTFEIFESNCADVAAVDCARVMYNALTMPLSRGQTFNAAEKKLLHDLENNIGKIKSEKIKEYFNLIADCIRTEKKLPFSHLWSIAKEMKYDTEGYGFVFYWYCFKQIEFIAVKTILLGKQFGLSHEKIMENLGDIYEQF
jgi:hypothetical protein